MIGRSCRAPPTTRSTKPQPLRDASSGRAAVQCFRTLRPSAERPTFTPRRNGSARILAIQAPERLTLATDGLSTPWAGISEPENGVECELFMEFDAARLDAAGIENWANLLINIGDLVADGYRVARDVEKHRAILFCRLTEDHSPMSRIMLSQGPGRIDGLPFGSVPLIRATPIAEAEIEGQDLSDDWGAVAARNALAKRGVGSH